MRLRYTKIESGSILDPQGLKRALTVINPNYTYQKDVLGIQQNRITVMPKFQVYQEDHDGNMHIPRAAEQDPHVAQYIAGWLPLSKIPLPTTHHSAWRDGKQLREHQKAPCQAIIKDQADMLIANCGSGKTICGTYIISITKAPVCIVVHTDFLAEQWKGELEEFTTIDDIVIHQNAKMDNSMAANVIIAKVQSLLNLPYDDHSSFYDRFNLAVIDEVHTMGSMEFYKAISSFPCKRIGLTATPERTDGFKTFKWCIGMREVVASDPNRASTVVIGFDSGQGKLVEESKYMMNTAKGPIANVAKLINHLYATNKDKEVDTTYRLHKRNIRILDIVAYLLDKGRHILLLSHRREHARFLFNNIDFKDKVLLLGGSRKCKDKEHHQLVVATFQYVRLSFNRPRLDCIVNTGPYSAYNDVKQSTGRIERIHQNKPRPVVIDVYDEDITRKANWRGIITKREGISKNMFKKRMRHYKKLGYNIYTGCSTVEELGRLISKEVL